MTREIGSAPLTVALDLRHPFSYLALEPAIALGEELGVEIDWLPSEVAPLQAPGVPGPDDDRGARHRRCRAEAIAREIETYAAQQGLELRDWYRDGDATAANLAWLRVRARRGDAVVPCLRRLLRAYWSASLDPASAEQVEATLRPVLGETTALSGSSGGSGSQGEQGWLACREALRERGLSGTPAYLVEDEVFHGRQHLPMIRWILQGRQGRGPI